MTKKQIRRYANFLIKKTWGQFHYEDDNWYGFFSKKQLTKHLKKVSLLSLYSVVIFLYLQLQQQLLFHQDNLPFYLQHL